MDIKTTIEEVVLVTYFGNKLRFRNSGEPGDEYVVFQFEDIEQQTTTNKLLVKREDLIQLGELIKEGKM